MESFIEEFGTEKVCLIKQNHKVYENIKALVQPNLIIIEDISIPIEEDDVIVRTLSNGCTERFVVIDRGFHQGMKGPDGNEGFPPSFQIKIRKETKNKPMHDNENNSIYNISNVSGKINFNSIDQSTTIQLSKNEEKLFNDLIELSKRVDRTDKLEKSIIDLRENIGKDTYKEKYNKFIQSIASNMTLFAPFIPVLSSFL